MPKRIVHPDTWECGICGEDHATKRKAENCERRGIVRPRYRMGQRVSVKRHGGRMRGIVCQVVTMFMHPFEHDTTIRYVICPDTATGDNTAVQMLSEERNMRSLGNSKRSELTRNVPDWTVFWKVFGTDDIRAREKVLLHLRERGIEARRLTGEPKLS